MINLISEVTFSTSRSSGPGGQNVNKVETAVELRFSILNSNILKEYQKNRLLEKLKSKLSQNGELILVSQRYRSQLRNKEDVVEKFLKLIEKSLQVAPKRIPSRPSKASVEKRLNAKKNQAERKSRRKYPLE